MKSFLRALMILLVLAVVGAVLAVRLGWIPVAPGPADTPLPTPSKTPLVTASVTPLAPTPSPSPLPSRDTTVLRVALDERASSLLFLALPQFIRDHRNDLKVECTIVPDAAVRWQLLAAGRFDLAVGTLDSFVLGAGRHDPGVVLFDVCESGGLDSLVARDVTSIAALKGSSIAVVSGEGGALLLGRFLNSAGLMYASVRMVDAADGQEALRLLQSGQVQGAVLWQPLAKAALQSKGVRTLASTRPDGRFLTDVCVASRSVLEKREAEVLELMQSWFELQAQLQANPRLGQEMVARILGRDPAEVGELLGAIRLVSLADNQKLTDRDVANEIRQLQDVWRLIDVPNNNGRFDVERVVQTDLVRHIEVSAPTSVFGASPTPSSLPSAAPSHEPTVAPPSVSPSSAASASPDEEESPSAGE